MTLTHLSNPHDQSEEWRFTITIADARRAVLDPVHMAILRDHRKSTKISEILAALALVAAGVEQADDADNAGDAAESGDHTSE
jgi:hypothetical protein